MILNVLDSKVGGLKIEKEIRYLYCIDWMGNHMRLLLKTPNIMLKKFIQEKERVQVKLSAVGIYMSDVMSISLERVPFLSNVISKRLNGTNFMVAF